MRSVLLTTSVVLLTLLIAPVPAPAVVGGERVAPASVPWYVGTGICGGTLVAPDRVVTAAHCLDPVDLGDVEELRIGREVRRGVRVALPPTWKVKRQDFSLDDIAIVQLDRPVTSVRPAALPAAGARLPRTVRIVGRGQIRAPGPGKPAPGGLFPLRQATLASVGDADCARRWRRSRSRYRTHFVAASMLCAIDRDGRAPRDNVCAGDSGGPLVSGPLARPVLLGVISWTGERCGADRLPSVAAEVDHFRDFVTDPDPVWAPVPGGPAKVEGDPRAGSTLRCVVPAWEVAPEATEIHWVKRVLRDRAYAFERIGSGATYAVKAADAGALVDCQVRGEGPGGRTQLPPSPALTRIEG